MAKVDALKCPNCGAAIKGEGPVTCPYCGSSLAVSLAEAERVKKIERELGTPGRRLEAGEAAYFSTLADVAITPSTRDIPFNPRVDYSKLPGGRLEPALAADAAAVVELTRTVQNAVNREELDSYMTTVHPAYASYAAKARAGAQLQFVDTDMKRYTLAVAFKRLTPEYAEALVTYEAFIFMSSGAVNHVEVTSLWKLKKYNGAWRVFASKFTGVKMPMSCGMRLAIIGPAVGLLIGVVAAVVGIAAHCHEQRKEEAAARAAEAAGAEEAPVWKAASRQPPEADRWYEARAGIPLYDSPAPTGKLYVVVKPATRFRVLSEHDGFYRVQAEGNYFGWARENVIKANLGKDYEFQGR